ncbi:MAG: penicillin-binding protein 2 [bacterium]
MEARDSGARHALRVAGLAVMMAMAFLALSANLWRIQVRAVGKFDQDVVEQSTRTLRVPGVRGRLLARGGEVLADNRPAYNVALDLAVFRRAGRWARTVDVVLRELDELRHIIGRPPALTAADIDRHIQSRLPMPLLAWRDLSSEELARFMEQADGRPGVEVVVEPVRAYPQGVHAAHVLGYVGRAGSDTDGKQSCQFVLPESEGRAGIEKRWNKALAGLSGTARMDVDVVGFRRGLTVERLPEAGADLYLTLDLRIQKLAEDALGDTPGAIVMLDPTSGDVLAMASAPGFDPNAFMPVFSASLWQTLNQDPAKPMLNRAMSEIYAPGSVFKPVVAMAALSSGRLTSEMAFDCPGYAVIGGLRIRCWNSAGHGSVALRRGIEQSCNAYFAQAGVQCGWEVIYDLAYRMGFGQLTGIDGYYEVAGELPNDAWKRQHWHEGWRSGDTANGSIGQGALAVTPLQMAVATAALANGGRVFRPRFVRGVQRAGQVAPVWLAPVLVRDLQWVPELAQAVRMGMYDVIMSPTGTGRRARIEGAALAGKTGTAEFGVKGSGSKHAWMIVFGPYEAPRYAMAMVFDQGDSGGSTVAPRVRRLMQSVVDGSEELALDGSHT